ncbi:unnamed protein product [Gemmataceae bacterium]|nr:unnamed protein product [Gemmataceae bacterium]VTU01212.1 unnamed protein product [Gemmataceae bacterium]
MNFFHLFAHGPAFDPDAFLAVSSLRPDHVWRRGEQKRGYEHIDGLPGHETGGVEFVLGDGRTILYPDQEAVALAFITAHRDELKALGRFPGADHFILMFHYEREFDGDMTGGCVGASQQLMERALDIGCRLDFTFIVGRALVEEQVEVADAEPGTAADGGA